MGTSLAALIVVAAVIAAAGVWLGRRVAHQRAELLSAGVRQLTAAMARAAETERAEILRTAEINGREEARASRRGGGGGDADARGGDRGAPAAARGVRGGARAAGGASHRRGTSASRRSARGSPPTRRRAPAPAARLRRSSARRARRWNARRPRPCAEAVNAIRDSEIEEARMVSARSERAAAEAAAEGAVKGAKRIMGIAVGRFYGHYLTERLHSVLPLPPGEAGAAIVGRDEANLRAIESVAGVTLALSEHHDSRPARGARRRRARGGAAGCWRASSASRERRAIRRPSPRRRARSRPPSTPSSTISAGAPSRCWRSRPRTRTSSSWSAGSTTGPATRRTSGSTPSRRPTCAG